MANVELAQPFLSTIDSKKDVILSGSGFGDNKTYRTEECLPADCYTLVLKDDYGDGMSCGNTGAYKLVVDGKVEEERDSHDFGDRITFKFGDCR